MLAHRLTITSRRLEMGSVALFALVALMLGVLVAYPRRPTVIVDVPAPAPVPTAAPVQKTIEIRAVVGEIQREPIKAKVVLPPTRVELPPAEVTARASVAIPSVRVHSEGVRVKAETLSTAAVAESVVGVDAMRVEVREVGMPPYMLPRPRDERDGRREDVQRESQSTELPVWVFDDWQMPAHHGDTNPCNKCHTGN